MSYNREELVRTAVNAAKKSYSPYSNFCVGAALLCANGEIFEGTNVENVSYGATNCAERTAFFDAVMNGKRDFVAIAIVGSKRGEEITSYCAPCGICRQVMAEFCGEDFEILLYDGKNIAVKTLGEILPGAFDKSNL
jgi:cytidine deaminase